MPKANILEPPATNRSAMQTGRIEQIEEEIDALRADKKEVWAEAARAGFDVRALRRAHALSKLDREQRVKLGDYAHSLSLFE